MILKCRVCEGQNIKSVLSLGFTPLANALLTTDQLNQPEEKYPLDLVFCEDCTLIQIVETVPPEILFRNDYVYNSSISQTTLENAKQNTDALIERLKLNELSTIVEIGSNDGYLLQNYVDHGIHCIGIDPAGDLAKEAEKRLGVRMIKGFFNDNRAKELKASGVSATVIHANNVLAHVAELHSVVEGIRTLLKPDGVAVIETHNVRELFDNVEFDCIYHEHLCYYSLRALEYLFGLHGMTLVDAEKLTIHGGSLRVYFQRNDGPKSLANDGNARVLKLMEEEGAWGIGLLKKYQGISENVVRMKKELLEMLNFVKVLGAKTAIYGASAKSTTLLNYFGIDSKLIDYVVDDTPQKQGRFTPGTHLPIYPSSKLIETQPEYVLILTWNFATEIMEKNTEYQKRGGRFIIPIPELKIVP